MGRGASKKEHIKIPTKNLDNNLRQTVVAEPEPAEKLAKFVKLDFESNFEKLSAGVILTGDSAKKLYLYLLEEEK